MTPSPEQSFDPRRAWLEDLLTLPHLWPEQVATVRRLADTLGIKIVIYERSLTSDNWRQRPECEE